MVIRELWLQYWPVFCAILELNNVGHRTKVSLFFLTGFISQKGQSVLKLPHIQPGPFVMSGAPSNPLPSEPAPELATVHMFTQSHCTFPIHTCFQAKALDYVITESRVINPACRCLRKRHWASWITEFIFHSYGKCWSQGSLSQGGESVMLITWQIPP